MAKKKIDKIVKNKVPVYDDSSIDVKEKDVDKIKERYGMYIGYSGAKATLHLIKEVLQNSIDEVEPGFGTKIIVTIKKIKSGLQIRVVDDGRGIPQGKMLELCTVLQASGKFAKGGAYKYAAGMNGNRFAVLKTLLCGDNLRA